MWANHKTKDNPPSKECWDLINKYNIKLELKPILELEHKDKLFAGIFLASEKDNKWLVDADTVFMAVWCDCHIARKRQDAEYRKWTNYIDKNGKTQWSSIIGGLNHNEVHYMYHLDHQYNNGADYRSMHISLYGFDADMNEISTQFSPKTELYVVTDFGDLEQSSFGFMSEKEAYDYIMSHPDGMNSHIYEGATLKDFEEEMHFWSLDKKECASCRFRNERNLIEGKPALGTPAIEADILASSIENVKNNIKSNIDWYNDVWKKHKTEGIEEDSVYYESLQKIIEAGGITKQRQKLKDVKKEMDSMEFKSVASLLKYVHADYKKRLK